MNLERWMLRVAALATVCITTACGGGGSGAVSAPPPPQAPAEIFGVAPFGSAAAVHSLGGGLESVPSEDGRWVAVVRMVGGLSQVFIRDVRAGVEEPVSVSSTGASANAPSGGPWISKDGRHVLFTSRATNLVDGVQYPTESGSALNQVFVRDRELRTTRLISVSADGASAGNLGAGIGKHSISADNRYVVFTSQSSNLTTGISYFSGNSGPNANIFIRDLQTQSTRIISVTPDGLTSGGNTTPGAPRYGSSSQPSISEDGSVVSFTSQATNLVSGVFFRQGDESNVYAWNRATGTNRLLSRMPGGSEASRGNCWLEVDAQRPNISADGGVIVFACLGEHLVSGLDPRDPAWGTVSDVYLWRAASDSLSIVTASANDPLQSANGPARNAVVSSDGRYIAFLSCATNLVLGYDYYGWTANGPAFFSVFRYSVLEDQMVLVSRSQRAGAHEAGDFDSEYFDMSADGSTISFVSTAENLVASPNTAWPPSGASDADTNVYVWRADNLKLITLLNDTTAAGYASPRPNMAANGSAVTFLRNPPVVGEQVYYYELN